MKRLRLSIPAAGALLLALLAAVGWAPGLRSEETARAVVVDISPSAEPLEQLPGEAILCADSDLGAALRRAAASRPGSILLYTDGCDLVSAAPAVPAVPVDVVLLGRRDNVRVQDLRVPARAAKGAPISIAVQVGRTLGSVRGDPLTVQVRLERDGERVGAAQEIVLERGQSRRVLFADRIDRGGFVRYRASLHDPVGPTDDDALEVLLKVGDHPLVLAVGEGIHVPGVALTRVAAADLAARLQDPAVGSAVDALVVGADAALPPAAQEAVVAAVRGGAGLLVLGGHGYAGRKLETVLPLTETPPDGRAVLLVVDVSGSMQPFRRDLTQAIRLLQDVLHPRDRIALLGFRDQVVLRFEWETVGNARWSLDAIATRGKTLLAPALAEALVWLAKEPKGERRLYVVSDGEWLDRDAPELERRLAEIDAAGVHRAAVFLKDDPPPAALKLFPDHVLATRPDDLRDSLRRSEQAAPDRVVDGPLPVRLAAHPQWLRGAERAFAEPVRRIARLYPRGSGESVGVFAGQIPVMAARSVGGRVVQIAADPARNPEIAGRLGAYLRAVLRERGTGEVTLRARREGRGLRVWLEGADSGRLTVGGSQVEARPVGPRRWEASVPRVAVGMLRVRAAGVETVVPAAASRELAGLTSDREVAAGIANRSGGVLYALGERPQQRGGAKRPGVLLLLLAGAALVLISATWRRKT
ncbi:MAG: VWA domain-containing protein [Planctomycetota bacterium]|nr:VWA domain-containing protein [Planctomycetota bacterium]